MREFYHIPVKTYPHANLNSTKGVIKAPVLKGQSVEHIQEHLAKSGVTHVKRVTIRKDNKEIETNTLILTFNKPDLPPAFKIFYRYIKVEPYIPNPLRCYKCQKFGHHETKCTAQNNTCSNCAENHTKTECTSAKPKCANCGEEHPSSSNKCSVWLREKEVTTIKYTRGISFPEARQLVYGEIHRPTGISYSKIVQSAQKTMTSVSTETDIEELDKMKPIGRVFSSESNKTSNQTKNQTQNSQKESTEKKKGGAGSQKKNKNTDRLPKGSNDPIKQHNRYEELSAEDCQDMETDFVDSRKSKNRGRSPVLPPAN